MIDDNFATFILTHGRPNNVKTYDTLIRQGYTGKIFIIVDNEDKTHDEYVKRFGDKVIVFDKKDIAERYDTGDNFTERRSVFFARNACFEIAKNLGIEYFLELDDDYRAFFYQFTEELEYSQRRVKARLNDLFAAMLKYYKSINASTIAFCQTGDIIGGQHSTSAKSVQVKRKAMNTFFCSTLRPFSFVGRVNEDVNTYTTLGNMGGVFLTIFNASMQQVTTQVNNGGMSELYRNEGTYIKSFYTVMYRPSCAKVSVMGQTNNRIHHKIKWDKAVPCIIDEKYKK